MSGRHVTPYTEQEARERLACIERVASREQRVQELGAFVEELEGLWRFGERLGVVRGWQPAPGSSPPGPDTAFRALDEFTIWVRTVLYRAEREHLPRHYKVAGPCPDCGLPLWRIIRDHPHDAVAIRGSREVREVWGQLGVHRLGDTVLHPPFFRDEHGRVDLEWRFRAGQYQPYEHYARQLDFFPSAEEVQAALDEVGWTEPPAAT